MIQAVRILPDVSLPESQVMTPDRLGDCLRLVRWSLDVMEAIDGPYLAITDDGRAVGSMTA